MTPTPPINTDRLWRSIVRWRNAQGLGRVLAARRAVNEEAARLAREARGTASTSSRDNNNSPSKKEQP